MVTGPSISMVHWCWIPINRRSKMLRINLSMIRLTSSRCVMVRIHIQRPKWDIDYFPSLRGMQLIISDCHHLLFIKVTNVPSTRSPSIKALSDWLTEANDTSICVWPVSVQLFFDSISCLNFICLVSFQKCELGFTNNAFCCKEYFEINRWKQRSWNILR